MNWHDKHMDTLQFGDHLADAIAGFIGSWKFLIIQSLIFVVWVIINSLYLFNAIHFDPYPFILFNLFMSAEAAYSSPLILMSQNRQAARDRHQAEMDFETTHEAKLEVEALQRDLSRIEIEKLDQIVSEHSKLHQKLDLKLDAILAQPCRSRRK